MSKVVVPLVLENGREIRVEAEISGRELVADSRFSVAELQASIIDVTTMVDDVLRRVAPKCATVEFGVTVGVQAGKLTALLLQGTAAANLKVTLTWERRDADERGA